MKSLFLCFGVILTLVNTAMALDCKLDSTPAKSINRCATPRTRGGEVSSETVKINNLDFNVWAAPQTYEQLYVYSCTDDCGNKLTLVGDVSWDCVANQEIAAIGVDQVANIEAQPICADSGSYSALTSDFENFIDIKYDNKSSRPSEMPAAASGIKYWQAEH